MNYRCSEMSADVHNCRTMDFSIAKNRNSGICDSVLSAYVIHQKLLIWQTYNGDIAAGKITRTFNICVKLCYAQKKL